MFWRKTRAAIEAFPPAHQSLVWHRGLSVTLDRRGWAALLGSLYQHSTVVKRHRWRLPPRTLDVLAPLVQALSQDLGARGTLAVTADLRGLDVPEKQGARRQLAVRRPVRSAFEWFGVDPWLRLRAELRDGSVLEIAVTDRVRYRQVRKSNRRGKIKTKVKSKGVQRIRATRVFPRDRPGVQPASPPPPWIRVKLRDGRHRRLTATCKLTAGPPAAEQVHHILAVAAESFRWTPASAGRTDRRTA